MPSLFLTPHPSSLSSPSSSRYGAVTGLFIAGHLLLVAFYGALDQLPEEPHQGWWSGGFLELVCLLFYLLDIFLHWSTHGLLYFLDKKWHLVYVIVVAMLVLDYMTYFIAGVDVRWAACMRSLLVVAKNSGLRRLFRTIVFCVPRIIGVFSITLVILVFYAILGMQVRVVGGKGERKRGQRRQAGRAGRAKRAKRAGMHPCDTLLLQSNGIVPDYDSGGLKMY